MPLQFQAKIEPVHVKAATAGIFWRQALQPLALALAAVLWLGLHLTLWVLFPTAPWFLHAGLALLLASTVGGAAWLAKQHFEGQALQNFSRFAEAPAMVGLEQEAYVYEAAWGQGRLPWDRFQSLWRFPSVWVLLQHSQGGVSVLLPSESLDDEAKAYILARLAETKADLRS